MGRSRIHTAPVERQRQRGPAGILWLSEGMLGGEGASAFALPRPACHTRTQQQPTAPPGREMRTSGRHTPARPAQHDKPQPHSRPHAAPGRPDPQPGVSTARPYVTQLPGTSEGLQDRAGPVGWGHREFLCRANPFLASRTSSCTSPPSGAAPRTDATSLLLSASAPAFSASSQRSVAQLSGTSGDERRESRACYTDERHPGSSAAPLGPERCRSEWHMPGAAPARPGLMLGLFPSPLRQAELSHATAIANTCWADGCTGSAQGRGW